MRAALAALVVLVAFPAFADGPDPLEDRAASIPGLIAAAPDLDFGAFAPDFLAAVPPERLGSSLQRLRDEHGAIGPLRLVRREGPFAARYEVSYAKGLVGPARVAVEAAPPHRFVALWFGAPAPALGSPKDAARQVAALPGATSFAVCRLGDGKPELLAGHEPDRVLAIGSIFKLWILGALVEDVAKGTRRWDEVVRLDPARRSLPSGSLQDWPAGAPVTLHTLAGAMISASDNTATDHLLHLLGRERVEAMLGPMGASAAARNRPFLSTREMFQLKSVAGEALIPSFAKADEKTRRALLPQVATVDLGTYRGRGTPHFVDSVEWFASAADLCRALDWFRRAPGGDRALELLAINPGVRLDHAVAFHGFKGGSEPGVLGHAHLLRTTDGRWLAVAALWNDGARAMDHAPLHGAVTSTLGLLAAPPSAAEK